MRLQHGHELRCARHGVERYVDPTILGKRTVNSVISLMSHRDDLVLLT